MKITRKDDGAVDVHCFRCGGMGWIGPAGYYRPPSNGRLYTSEDDVPGEKGVEGYLLPEDATDRWEVWPKGPRTWLTEAGIGKERALAQGFLWSEFRQTLFIPVTQDTSAFGPKAVGFVLRRFSPKRYLTLAKDKAAFWGLYRAPQGHSSTLVLVESVIDALRVSDVADTLSLMGTSLRPQALSYVLSEGYKDVVVWLDGDNPTVQREARRIARQLSFLPTRIVETGRDPKSYSKEELDTMLNVRYTDLPQTGA